MQKNTFSPKKLIAGLGALALTLTASASFADTFENVYDANLAGANSVPPVHSAAFGTFTTKIAEDMGVIHYSMHYDDLAGVPVAVHIHFAQKFANGAPLVTICNNGNPDIQDCPASGGYLDGTISVEDIQAIPAQGVHAGVDDPASFDALVLFMKVGFTYVNVHTLPHHDSPTTQPPVSELRGQLEINDHPFPIKK